MANTPFRDTATKIAQSRGYVAMAVECEGARSHTWWKRLVEYGPWETCGYGRVAPPDREALDGIARLFGTTADHIATMIAADWYGVYPEIDLSTRVLRLSPVLDKLSEADAEILEALAHRLASSVAQSS